MSGPRICDYGDSTYRTDFWEGRGREYEDAVERLALRRLLKEPGKRLLEIGAGFGRLASEYSMYEQVTLLDYSLEQLQFARQRYGDDAYIYVAADAYQMPFCIAAFDGATMIRVIHHFVDVPAVLAQVNRVVAGGGQFILEFANKRNLKAMLRHALGRNDWDPYAPEAVEFVELNFNFHPKGMIQQTAAAGFNLRGQIPVSWLRLGALKRSLPTGLLVALDRFFQRSALLYSPSIFLDLRRGGRRSLAAADSDAPLAFLRCPRTGSALQRQVDCLVSQDGLRWGIKSGVYDFRQPL
ncbi:MAG: class I SAM-dependent methyltransferase [Chloroflexota bacterium]|nr:class I SAM-dependent methyltransferase [Chloroflexota bacterium]MCY3583605.1 class I SAM-dependent methyltransferase [Chloroflexota bacterium]MDE2651270.1 class I SAM-dependent methyltransferase [Chloroflexota bacterium]MXV92053.1 class I SAM-dependent methyltransferase [Chloroflexota bacterium]MXX49850.1 class I SAM-dependent methyltransferase [Chloroflexota bacterium]